MTVGAWLSDPTVAVGEVNQSEMSSPSETRISTVHWSPARVATAGSVVVFSSDDTWTPSSIHRISVEVIWHRRHHRRLTTEGDIVVGVRRLALTVMEETSGAEFSMTTALEATGVPSSSPSDGVTTACHESPFVVAEEGRTAVVWPTCKAPLRCQAKVVPLSPSLSSSL